MQQITASFLAAALQLCDEAGPNCRIPATTVADATARVQRFVDRAGPWVAQALATPGYTADRLGTDLWLTAAGHGVGFWDRDELSAPPTAGTFPLADRDGKPYLPAPGATLGECLTAAAYGTHTAIAPGAYCDAYTARGWLYLI